MNTVYIDGVPHCCCSQSATCGFNHSYLTEIVAVFLCCSLLKGAEELAIRKPVKSDFGGGMKEFVFEDQEYFLGVDDSTTFLTSQERQSIVKHMLYNLRAVEGDTLNKMKFLEGQAIGKLMTIIIILTSYLNWHIHSQDKVHVRRVQVH